MKIIFKGLMRIVTTLDALAAPNQSFYSIDKHYCLKNIILKKKTKSLILNNSTVF